MTVPPAMTGAEPNAARRSQVRFGQMPVPLSVLVFTFDEELNIAACLDTVVGWADQILVLDSGSRDRTLELCSDRRVEVVHHPYLDHRSQMEYGITQLPWKHDWLLLLDADNQVRPELRAQIGRVLSTDGGTIHGYYARHDHYFRNRRIFSLKGHWLRLIRRSHVGIDQSELVDFRLLVRGPTGALSGAIVESNQKELDIDFWIDKHQKFARRMALEEVLRNEGALAWSQELSANLFGSPDERMIWLKNRWYRMPLYVRPLVYFVYRYVLCGGFLGGWNGFIYDALQSFWFRLIIDLNIAEYREQLRLGHLTLEDLIRKVGRPLPPIV